MSRTSETTSGGLGSSVDVMSAGNRRSRTLIVRDVAALHRRGLHGVRAVKLELPDLSDERRTHYESTINRSLRACGCEWAAAFGAVTALCGLGGLLLLRGGPQHVSPAQWIGWFLCVGAAMGAGKLIGKRRARRRAFDIVEEIVRLRRSP